jgi:hypothetical protein
MRKDVLIAMLAIVLLGAASVSAKARSQSCSAGEFVNGLLSDGSISCSVPVDTNTDTNAGTLCTTGEYLDGDGSCYPIPEDTDTNTNAGTLCTDGQYLDGDGSCKPSNVISSPNGDFSISVTNAGIFLSGPASEIELNNAGDVIINGVIIEMDASAQIDMDAAIITLN